MLPFCSLLRPSVALLIFFNDTATTDIYTLSLHDALPISRVHEPRRPRGAVLREGLYQSRARSLREDTRGQGHHALRDRKSTRLNSSHRCISYAVFCLKKKKKSLKTIPYKTR